MQDEFAFNGVGVLINTKFSKAMLASVVSVSLCATEVFAQSADSASSAQVAPAPAASAVLAAPAAPPANPPQPAPMQYIQVQAPAAAAGTNGDAWTQEFALWQAAAQGNSIDEYQGYLKAYPNGKFASIAQARIVKLTAEQDVAKAPDLRNEPEMPPPGPALGTPQTESVVLAERGTRREVQARLTALGFNTGGTDGVLGGKSRTAISQWQAVVGAPVTGFLSYEQLVKLRADSETAYQQWLASRPPARIVRSRDDELVGRVDDSSAADAAIALGVLGLAVGAMGAASAGRHHYRGPGPHGHALPPRRR
jgi:hypothetical protein